mgnify:CR=1 FL=1
MKVLEFRAESEFSTLMYIRRYFRRFAEFENRVYVEEVFNGGSGIWRPTHGAPINPWGPLSIPGGPYQSLSCVVRGDCA